MVRLGQLYGTVGASNDEPKGDNAVGAVFQHNGQRYVEKYSTFF